MERFPYVTEVPYTWSFFPGLSPPNLAYIARMHGHPVVDLARPFRYLELGCGQGLCVSTFAACFPQATFHGVDLNEQHICRAREVAAAGRLANLTFHRATFGEFLDTREGDFDFIALHGVYSWVPTEVRAQIGSILRTRLAPGGVVYVTYNAMPGWAPLLPLRRIMLEYTATRGDLPLLERVSQALAYLCFLRDQESDYFRSNPAAGRELDRLLQDDPRYVAHEFFAFHWGAFYFADVDAELGACGLEFAGTSPVLTNLDDLHLPERFRRVLDTATDPVTRQTHRVFVVNESFRRDVYVRPRTDAAPPALRDLWGAVRFGPKVPADRVSLDLECPVGTVSLAGPVYPVLARLLGGRAWSFRELCAHPELAAWDEQVLLHALHRLVAGGQFGVFVAPPRTLAPGPRGRLRLSLFNRFLLQERIGTEAATHLAAPVLGTGLPLGQVEMLMTLALDQAGPEGPGAWACDFLENRQHTLKIGGEPVPERDRRLDLIAGQVSGYEERTLPQLIGYGILQSGGDGGPVP